MYKHINYVWAWTGVSGDCQWKRMEERKRAEGRHRATQASQTSRNKSKKKVIEKKKTRQNWIFKSAYHSGRRFREYERTEKPNSSRWEYNTRLMLLWFSVPLPMRWNTLHISASTFAKYSNLLRWMCGEGEREREESARANFAMFRIGYFSN